MKPDPSPEADRNQDPQEGLLTFPLAGLLPANQTLVLNLSMRTATLFSTSPDGEAQVLLADGTTLRLSRRYRAQLQSRLGLREADSKR